MDIDGNHYITLNLFYTMMSEYDRTSVIAIAKYMHEAFTTRQKFQSDFLYKSVSQRYKYSYYERYNLNLLHVKLLYDMLFTLYAHVFEFHVVLRVDNILLITNLGFHHIG